MKTDLYKIFEEFTPEFEDTDNNIRSERIKTLVKRKMTSRKTSVLSNAVKKLIIGTAVAACMGITAGAVSGKLDEFIKALSDSSVGEGGDFSELPSVGENTDSISEFFSVPEAVFTENGNISGEFVGMYNGNNCVMLTMRITVPNAINCENAQMPFSFTVIRSDGTEYRLSESIEPLIPSDSADSYYVTYYLTDRQIAGSRLKIEADGIYTNEQVSAAMDEVRAFQEKKREEFEAENGMDTALWKEYWESDDLDGLSNDTFRSYLKSCNALETGELSAEFNVPEPICPTIKNTSEFGNVTLDPLSLHIIYSPDTNRSNNLYEAYAVYLSDGTVISNDFFMTDDFSGNSEHYHNYAYIHGTENGRIFCFGDPIDITNVDKIVVYTQAMNDNYEIDELEYILYER